MQQVEVEMGQEIGVLCDLSPGPFSDEFLVTIETISGPMSGFVPENLLVRKNENENYVLAIVKNVDSDVISVLIGGSFFTTTGLALIPPHIAANL
jgi:hypothetical protein